MTFYPYGCYVFFVIYAVKKNNLHPFWRDLFFSIDANTAKTRKRNKLLFSTHILSLQDNLDDI
jgi:hypothetical protein